MGSNGAQVGEARGQIDPARSLIEIGAVLVVGVGEDGQPDAGVEVEIQGGEERFEAGVDGEPV